MDFSIKCPETRLVRASRKLVYSGSILDIYEDEMLLPNGNTETWNFMSHKSRGGAAVVPVLPDGRIMLIRQYRPGTERMTLELPAGARNPLPDGTREEPIVTAMRELEEETGYTCEKLKPLVKLKSAVAYCDEQTEVFLAENIRLKGEQKLDQAESIDTVIMTPDELKEIIYSGKLNDSKTVAGVMAYLCKCR